MTDKLDREFLIEWCHLLTGYSRQMFEKLSDADLNMEYERVIKDANDGSY